jgi:ribosome modulation factor
METQTEQPAADQTAPPAGKKRERKAKAPKAPPIALKDIPDETIAHHAEKLLIAQQKLDDAMKEVQAKRGEMGGVLDVAKKDGIPKAKLKAYIAAMKRDQVEAREEMEFIERVARIMNDDSYLEQMELFKGSPEVKKAAAPKAEGRSAGKSGRSAAENPYAPGTEQHQEWNVGWNAGQADIVKGMAPKGRAKTAADRKPADATVQ